jgi:hypothetical protein
MELKHIIAWGNTLSEFSYLVTRKHFSPRYCYGTISKREPMGMLTTFVNSIGQYELFEIELLDLISEKRNPEKILMFCDEKIMPSIRYYRQWYSDHQKETEIFGAYNPYKIMSEMMTRTEKTMMRFKKPDMNTEDLIIDRVYLDLIFKKYGLWFKGETSQTWLARFINSSEDVDPINVGPAARADTDRLVLIAILASIMKMTGNSFDFDKFVSNRFGIAGYSSAKSRYHEKQEFKDIVKFCDGILNK